MASEGNARCHDERMSSGGAHGMGVAAAAGTPGTGAMRSLRGGSRKPPDLMDPTRRRDGRRILALFRPYRLRLAVVLVMIIASAGVSMLNQFLLRDVVDRGLIGRDAGVLGWATLGMIGVALFSNATSVWQTYLSNVVGQRVMHGLDAVVTTTATTIAANATTVIAALVAMCLLDVRLALFSLVFVPPSVWATRRIGKLRRSITVTQQKQLADLSALVSESLSVSGILLGKTMGRGDDLAERFTAESRT